MQETIKARRKLFIRTHTINLSIETKEADHATLEAWLLYKAQWLHNDGYCPFMQLCGPAVPRSSSRGLSSSAYLPTNT